MMNPHYPECRALPAINETFSQFSQHRPAIAVLSPLDLSLRAGTIIPITPPSTPSPPRKRQRLMSEENYLWRPHAMNVVSHAAMTLPSSTTSSTTYFHHHHHHHQQQHQQHHLHQHQHHHQQQQPQQSQQHIGASCYGLRFEGGGGGPVPYNKSHFPVETKSNFERIPANHSSVQVAILPPHTQLLKQPQEHAPPPPPTIYVDDETIVLTEDENETVVSSHDYTEDTDIEEVNGSQPDAEVDAEAEAEADADLMLRRPNKRSHAVETVGSESDADDEVEADNEDDEEDVYVDILSNDDDDNEQPTMRLQAQLAEAKALKRNELLYDNEELHNQAVDGLARLFERNFDLPTTSQAPTAVAMAIAEATTQIDCGNSEKTYTDLGNFGSTTATTAAATAATTTLPLPQQRGQKSERKRSKLRKHTAVDEETISPVSGTIIRKLRDDEELVVRKGDIDPAFNVVEITEEAKAILASIDNKIGAYLCQLCRTLYDDAFMLAQHRCPRIVHIEYKCSECEKVFNCPANLASHRRWHKPKGELSGNIQTKKRQLLQGGDPCPEQSVNQLGDKATADDSADGIYPCHQCGKSFRRHAYLKKHQASHQMLENLKNLNFFKTTHSSQQSSLSSHSSVAATNFPPTVVAAAQYPIFNATTSSVGLPRPPPCIPPMYPSHKNYGPRFAGFPFQSLDQRRFYSLGELYLSQQLERHSSAFQYVQANHLRQLTVAANNLLPREPPVTPPGIPLPVK